MLTRGVPEANEISMMLQRSKELKRRKVTGPLSSPFVVVELVLVKLELLHVIK